MAHNVRYYKVSRYTAWLAWMQAVHSGPVKEKNDTVATVTGRERHQMEVSYH